VSVEINPKHTINIKCRDEFGYREEEEAEEDEE